MKSPLSDEPMLVLELSGVEIDYCTFTNSIWLDAGELETFLDNPKASAELMASFVPDNKSRELKVRCPICRKKMEKVVGPNQIIIDRCKKGHGLWFDDGELEAILELEQSGSGKKVAALLKDMFAHKLNKKD